MRHEVFLADGAGVGVLLHALHVVVRGHVVGVGVGVAGLGLGCTVLAPLLQVKQEIQPSVSATSSSSFSVQLTKVCSFFELNILAIDCMRNTCLDP